MATEARQPWRLALTALHGGCGASTVAAGILLAWPHHSAIQLIDADPANRACQALGLGLDPLPGWSDAWRDGRPWRDALHHCGGQASLLPCGEAPLDTWPALTPSAWQAGLDSLPACTTQLMVSGPPGSPCWHLVCQSADLVCVVATPDVLVSTPPARLRLALGESGMLLINRFRPERRADLGLLGLARQHWLHWLLPIQVHDDTAVAEALWLRQSLHAHAPASQAAHDLAVLTGLLQQQGIRTGALA